GEMDAKDFAHSIAEVIHMYPENVNEVAFNLLDSHDTARILTLANGNLDKVKLLYLFQLSFIGTPCLYYGDEIGMAGGGDPECRACMIWDEAKQNRELFNYVKQLIKLRKSEPVFGNGGKFKFIHADNESDYIIYEKYDDAKRMVVIINNSNEKLTIPVIDELADKNVSEYFIDIDPTAQANEQPFSKDTKITVAPTSFRVFGTKQ